MAALTPTDIANMAIALLDEAMIDTLEDDVKVARLMNVHYEQTREAELEKNTWIFAILSSEVEGAAIEQADGSTMYAYELPADCIRPLPLTLEGIPISWRQEAGTIYSDQSGPLTIRYIGNLVDPNDWSALFTDVLVAALAVKFAIPLTHKTGMLEVAQNAYDRAVREARRVNAIQRSGTMYQQSWAQARGDDRFWRA